MNNYQAISNDFISTALGPPSLFSWLLNESRDESASVSSRLHYPLDGIHWIQRKVGPRVKRQATLECLQDAFRMPGYSYGHCTE